jgi:hypothetical protein
MDDQLPDDGLKWFGEGFDGFPKRLPDDCVEYMIHVIDQNLVTASTIRGRLNDILKAANAMKKKLLKDYIWQRQGFELSVHPKVDLSTSANSSQRATPHLSGRTDFGDSVADEWLVVYLLHELSKQFADAWIRVYDTDGEFLLIESANSLPKWLNPEIAENRVWINNGHLKIIPLKDDAPARNLSTTQALSFIRESPDELLVDSAIEKEAFHRLREYPSAISSSLHHALVTVPRPLAYILHRNPACISPAIEAFYLRDPVSLKPLATKDTNTLNFAPEDFVTVSVKFTKVGFAQLRSQIFDPPPSWVGILSRIHDEKVAIGMKLTCGFEMLVTDTQNQAKRVVREIKLLLEDLENGEEQPPTDVEIAEWPKTQDDEKWLDIDYNDFEKELSGTAEGKSSRKPRGGGFGDEAAQANLQKMVSRFEDFLKDDSAGADGIDDMDEDDAEEVQSSDEDGETKQHEEREEKGEGSQQADTGNHDEDAAFERAIHDTRAMPEWHLEKSGLLEQARQLALQFDEDMSEVDEDEGVRKVIEFMEQELKGHGALDLQDGLYRKTKAKEKGKSSVSEASKDQTPSAPTGKPVFGPERPPHMLAKQAASSSKQVHFEDVENADEEIDRWNGELGDGELSSDDEEFNDVDLGLAKNMLESFKGQAGMSGPAGNMMKALGVGMPRDEGE